MGEAPTLRLLSGGVFRFGAGDLDAVEGVAALFGVVVDEVEDAGLVGDGHEINPGLVQVFGHEDVVDLTGFAGDGEGVAAEAEERDAVLGSGGFIGAGGEGDARGGGRLDAGEGELLGVGGTVMGLDLRFGQGTVVDAEFAHVAFEIAGGDVVPAWGVADAQDAVFAAVGFAFTGAEELAVHPDLLTLAGVLEDEVGPFVHGNIFGRDGVVDIKTEVRLTAAAEHDVEPAVVFIGVFLFKEAVHGMFAGGLDPHRNGERAGVEGQVGCFEPVGEAIEVGGTILDTDIGLVDDGMAVAGVVIEVLGEGEIEEEAGIGGSQVQSGKGK